MKHYYHPKHQGFTLVELLVSLAIGFTLLTMIVQLYATTSRVNTDITETNYAIENGRLTIDFLGKDIAHGGFWNGYIPEFDDLSASAAPSDYPTAIPDPCLDYASWDAAYKANFVALPVQVYDTVPATCSSLLPDRQAGTDVIVIRHANTPACNPVSAGSCTAGALHFQTSMCEADGNYQYTLSDDLTALTETQRDCTTRAEAREVISNIYYVRNYAVTSGDGVPTLMRSSLGVVSGVPTQLSPVALIEGVESFKIELGIDNISDSGAAVDHSAAIVWADESNKDSPTNRGDGIPDGEFVRCTTLIPCTVAQLVNTVSVKLGVLVRNLKTTQGYTDTKTYTIGTSTIGPFNNAYQRYAYNTTVRLANVSGRRETP